MKIGFIGLGAMGGYMAINLAKNKFNQVINWLESNPDINENDNRYFSYSISSCI